MALRLSPSQLQGRPDPKPDRLPGVIALMGMIMRNSVILIDQIEPGRRQGLPAWDAIVDPPRGACA